MGRWNRMLACLTENLFAPPSLNCEYHPVEEGMTAGGAPRLLTATLSKAVPTGGMFLCSVKYGINFNYSALRSTP